ncbi:hypothetical protein CALCODRAFT_483340 [Calocera cornea HHB12733]|uniref:Uncharacterized protein n=1 Tax=Calocera cornea HHB12733 TaxID=1353952 RepID=A0A165FVZ8_9BASI|nr:hypothetical protein CALCODRAFT_483340 [Calocera cornea HHB12733]
MPAISARNSRLLLLVLGIICVTPITYVSYRHYDRWSDVVSGGSVTSEAPKRTVIIMSDSRELYIPEDGSEIPYWTLSALLNKAYADSQGAEFLYYVFIEPEFAEGENPAGDEGTVACKHPRLGWRAHSWCKVPLVWQTFQTHNKADYAIYIGTPMLCFVDKIYQ